MNDPAKLNRRQVLELCISRGLLAVAVGSVLLPRQLFAAWQQAEQQALKPTAHEAFGPLFLKGAPNQRVLRVGHQRLPKVYPSTDHDVVTL
jgi:hypothetical protein